MPVVPRGVDDRGAMALPDSAFTVGWYRFGSRPLDRTGATVLAGHVDTRAEGVGPLALLAAVRVGDLIEVRAGRRTVTYRTTSVTRVSKALLDLPAVFSRVGPPAGACGHLRREPTFPRRADTRTTWSSSARRLSSGS